MRAEQILALWAEHGGIARIHVTPVRGGWKNVVVCRDGFRRTNSAREDCMILEHQRRKRK